MKRIFRTILSITLCLIMVLGNAAVGGEGFAEVLEAFSLKASATTITSYSTGDIIEFGWYPQTKETDVNLITALNELGGNNTSWASYDYYSGTGNAYNGQMQPSDYMRYKDVMYGTTKYRGVVFDSYRTSFTGSSFGKDNTYQFLTGYSTGTIYWFKYEPIKWRVLDPSTGLVLSESILDSQAYSNYILYEGDIADPYYSYTFWGNSAKTHYANNYAQSSIRQWLNYDFYNTAFSTSQQNNIQFTTLDNRAYSTSRSAYDSASTTDKIFLLSYSDALNSSYGFSSNSSRMAQGSDYAKCQNLYTVSSDVNSNWRLRSAGDYSDRTCNVHTDGDIYNYYSASCTGDGIRVAFKMNLTSNIFQSSPSETGKSTESGCNGTALSKGDIIEFGWYPQTKVTDSGLIFSLDSIVKNWINYDFYASNKMNEYMKYCDIIYSGSKYRAVTFSSYKTTYNDFSIKPSDSHQDDNGYFINNVYYFKWEPLKWRVLDPNTNFIVSEKIIDSQVFCFSGSKSTHTKNDITGSTNDFEISDIREWLDGEYSSSFYNTCFNETEKVQIHPVTHYSSDFSDGVTYRDTIESTDNVFLLSYTEANNTSYFANESSRTAYGTDYALCMGLKHRTNNTSDWLLRSAGYYSNNACYVVDRGYLGLNYGWGVNMSDLGIRPAMELNTLSGTYPQENNSLTEIKINSLPIKTDYYLGDTVSLDGLSIIANYDGVSETVIGDCLCTPSVLNKVGEQEITVNYCGKTCSFFVNVELITLSNIEVLSLPSKIDYYCGDTLDISGLTIKANYTKGVERILSESFSASPTILTEPGKQTITVTFNEKTATFTVNVSQASLSKIEINTYPTLLNYVVNDTIDTSGLTLKATYNNGTTTIIEDGFQVSPQVLLSSGTIPITITYGEKKCSFNVTVKNERDTNNTINPYTGEYYKTGDIFYFGSYPQSRVNDNSLIINLNQRSESINKWKSYDYYTGSGKADDGLMKPTSYMKYTDIIYNGAKYRGVYFSSYRPINTGYVSSAEKSWQDGSGYVTETVYWFKYEPLRWRVLDSKTGLCMCDYIIDSQAFNNYDYYYFDGTNYIDFFSDSDKSNSAIDFSTSSIRKWLNDDFYCTAFNDSQKSNIKSTQLTNKSFDYPKYSFNNSTDMVFLLSYDDICNSNYGFNNNPKLEDQAKMLAGTDYALCQGLLNLSLSYKYQSNINDSLNGRNSCQWRLRTPIAMNYCYGVEPNGKSYQNTKCSNNTDVGIVPALRLICVESDLSMPDDVEEPACTINYISRNSTNIPQIQFKQIGNNITISSVIPERDGFVFKEWNTDENGSGKSYYPNDTYDIDKDLTLYAQWDVLVNENVFEYGLYPQTLVINKSLISELNLLEKSWKSYGYYVNSCQSNYMEYCDISYQGEKYRAVTFSSYRPYYSSLLFSKDNSNLDENYYLDENGLAQSYLTNTIYYFKWEPLKWRVLDSETGFCICESIIDSQQFYSGANVHNKNSIDGSANDYEISDIREWLDGDLDNSFYNLAFSNEEKTKIRTVTHSSSDYSKKVSSRSSITTSDRIFLLSYTEANNTMYFADDADRMAAGTDYAWCQGLFHATDDQYIIKDGNLLHRYSSRWWLRSAGVDSDIACGVIFGGDLQHGSYVYYTSSGVRPAMQLTIIPNQQTYKVTYCSTESINIPEPQIKKAKNSINITDKIPYRSGYIFMNWNTAKDGSGKSYYPNDTYDIDKDLTLYAQWQTNMIDIVGINANKNRTLSYRTTITFYSNMDIIPNDSDVIWTIKYSDGTTEIKHGEKVTLNEVTKSFEISCQLLDANKYVLSTSQKEVVTVKNGFFDKLISFFGRLFNKSSYIIYQK